MNVFVMPGHSPSKTGVSALMPRPSRSGGRCAILSGVTGPSPVTTSYRNRAGNFSVGRLFEFLTALGQDVRITVKPAKNRQGEMAVVVG